MSTTKSSLYRAAKTVTPICAQAGHSSAINRRDSQLLFGEGFIVEEEDKDWLYGRSEIDDYTGWVEKKHMQADIPPPTNFTDNLWTHIYPEPSFKTRPLTGLSLLSRLHIGNEDDSKDGFIHIPQTGWIFAAHLKPLAQIGRDKEPVETALDFLNAPYLYSGRSAQGIDCSGLVQIALLRAGINCPRDSDQQCAALGHDIPLADIQRGDIVFFPGHVGIMIDSVHILNATARHMRTLIEPLETVTQANYEILGIRRV